MCGCCQGAGVRLWLTNIRTAAVKRNVGNDTAASGSRCLIQFLRTVCVLLSLQLLLLVRSDPLWCSPTLSHIFLINLSLVAFHFILLLTFRSDHLQHNRDCIYHMHQSPRNAVFCPQSVSVRLRFSEYTVKRSNISLRYKNNF
jgi:hypothetical protein